MHQRAVPSRPGFDLERAPTLSFVHAFQSMTAKPTAEVSPRDG